MMDSLVPLKDVFQSRYVIERELGRGGMATVYLAQDLKLHRQVALKVLHAELAATLGPERFQREIRLAAQLSHPNIVPVFDSGEAEGRLWYAMLYVDGESLRQRLNKEAQLGVAEALRITSHVADALAHAHTQGIVHRDIKPENILLAGDRAMVADFGVAKALDVSGAEKITEPGLSVGTPAYMSPEQGAGGAVDARSDIYSLGCVLYEMLAGGPPFAGPSARAIMARHAVDPVPPLHTVRATVPEAVEQAVLRALAKVPADRFASAAEFARALTIDHAPSPALWTLLPARFAKLGLGLAIGLVAGGALWTLRRASGPAVNPSEAAIAVLPLAASASDTALIRLGRDLAVTISATLSGVGGIKTADRLSVSTATADRPSLSASGGAALARRLGARSILRGTIVGAGSSVRLDLGLYATDGLAPLAEGITVTADRDSIGLLTDSVAWALLRQIWRRGEPPSPSLASVTTQSLPAVRAFLQGERQLGENRWEEARLAYQSAVAADSAFWLARFRLGLVRYWIGEAEGTRESVSPEVMKELRSHQGLLSEEERSLMDAFFTTDRTPRVKMERHALVTRRFPDYWPGWFLYGDALYHWGPMAGHAWPEALEAFRRAVALNPTLVPAWEHIFELTVGRDPAEASGAFARLTEMGWLASQPPGGRMISRLLASVGATIEPRPSEVERLMDSAAAFVASSRPDKPQAMELEPLFLLEAGFPSAQLELNRRVLTTGRVSPQLEADYRAANAWAWVARGRWDSALTIMDTVAETHPGPIVGGWIPARERYKLAVVGAWLGATEPTLADQRRPAAVAAIDRLGDEASRQSARAATAWLDGILAFARGDRRAIQAARRAAAASRYYQADLVDRSLAAFDRALAGDRKTAGRKLAELEDYCLEHENCNSFTPHFAIQRLAAAQWLQEAGSLEEARRLLRWQDAPCHAQPVCDALAAPTFLSRGRIEMALGDSVGAREYYRQFLRRYDQPMPSQANLVAEARGALTRLTDRP